ncbi:hypothetical protein MKS88_004933 [Plasmodium brasilianum]|uniref:Arp2/3 complex 34 kDa subunit n=2 Tax=Plasmodium (Plasmodium) TaxID=418103 RepID=A0A1A8W8Y5_PLAMA|nr:conserved Plasmodium protein, unknown function [Plasmodium malariae]KAI4835717.1 hypothetical protein MKS88_004933 [Plasmodium brasilianum]SBS89486.1 conserved Plasmodium protein, unknown function [Plasmodium malariae]SCP02649.1 conserved Plasmodium protein, unknown function [Plasmodium malariae]
MCERLYRKIKDSECGSNLYITNNKVLFDSVYKLIKEGVPMPCGYYVNEKIVNRETDRYVLTKYIYDVDDIIYKVEAHSKVNLEKTTNLRVKCLEQSYLKDNEVEDLYKYDTYNQLDSIQIYVSHNNFSYIWNEYTMQYFLSCYHDEHNLKIHTHILEKEQYGYDLQIELYEIPNDPIKAFLVASHLSKIREALQCSPLMHFFLTRTNTSENAFEKIIIRKNEIIYLFKNCGHILVIISIHYEHTYDKCIVLGLCKNIHITTKTMDLCENLDCSFYTDFPSHLITSELFVYSNDNDKDNNSDMHNYGVERENQMIYSIWTGKKEKHNQINTYKDVYQGEHTTTDTNAHYIEKNLNDEKEDKGKSKQANSNENVKAESNNKLKIPNVGFISLKMDAKLFTSCKDFSELIQLSSRISHIVVSFREYLNNSLVLYRIKRRRAF